MQAEINQKYCMYIKYLADVLVIIKTIFSLKAFAKLKDLKYMNRTATIALSSSTSLKICSAIVADKLYISFLKVCNIVQPIYC